MNESGILRIDEEAVAALTFGQYRKLPVVIEAVKIDEPFEVETLEGTHRGNPGDYLIRGIKGELYPCKPDIFAETYEVVRITERCCVCDEHGENQCPNEAKWQTWDKTKRYDETFNDYCDEHLIDGMRESGRTIVWEIQLVRDATEAL